MRPGAVIAWLGIYLIVLPWLFISGGFSFPLLPPDNPVARSVDDLSNVMMIKLGLMLVAFGIFVALLEILGESARRLRTPTHAPGSQISGPPSIP